MAEHDPLPGSERSPGAEHDYSGGHQQQHSPGSERLREAVRDGFTIMLGAASWAFEQGDRMVDTWLHQGQVTREDSRRRFQEVANRTRQAGENLTRRVSGSVPVATRDQVASLERRIDELTRQIESLKGSAPPSGASVTRERPHP
jgi:polyhydroxyalkanoate synthesis regulator phasin